MSNRLRVVIAAVIALVFSVVATSPAYGQAYGVKFVTSITYQNVGTGAAGIRLQFYPERSGAPVTVTLANLPQNAGTSVYVGNLSELSSGFKGGAVMSSDQPIVATMVQVPQSGITNRPLSNGFSPTDGGSNVLIATVLKNTFDANTQFSVQNVDTSAADLTLTFVDAAPGAAAIAPVTVDALPAGSVAYFDATTVAGLPATFNGSVTIAAVRDGTTTPGKIVATALELGINKPDASAFEGVTGGSPNVYLPSAICNAFGGQSTAYAVQNTNAAGGANVNVTVTYLARNTAVAGSANETFTATATIAPGAKASFNGCGATGGPSGMPAGYSGSATISATGGNIVAIAKVFGAGLSGAAPGVGSGTSKLALPYVRYSVSAFDSGARNRQRTFLAIQNIGSADLAAGAVTVRYLDKNGTVVGTHSLPAIARNAKVNSNPLDIGAAGNEFGYYDDGTFGGSAIVEGPSGSQLVVVARVAAAGTGEDYNGIPIAP
jgi:hypothetical protein